MSRSSQRMLRSAIACMHILTTITVLLDLRYWKAPPKCRHCKQRFHVPRRFSTKTPASPSTAVAIVLVVFKNKNLHSTPWVFISYEILLKLWLDVETFDQSHICQTIGVFCGVTPHCALTEISRVLMPDKQRSLDEPNTDKSLLSEVGLCLLS